MPFCKSLYEPIPLPSTKFINLKQAKLNAINFFNIMSTRHSIRDFSSKKVDKKLIEIAISTAGRAPSGANQQPWHFVAVNNSEMKRKIREAAEIEEKSFYEGGGGDEWLAALEPLGTNPNKFHLTDAPWLIIVFSQRYGIKNNGTRYKHYYVPESVGIATGILITALHNCGLYSLVHTPNPMSFLNEMCKRPLNEKPTMIIPVGYPSTKAKIPRASLNKKPLTDILSIL